MNNITKAWAFIKRGISVLCAKETEDEMMARIDKAIEPEVKAEMARMEKNFECHHNIGDCSNYQHYLTYPEGALPPYKVSPHIT